MVKVQVRVDHDVDVRGSESVLLKLVEQRGWLLNVVDAGELGVELVADAGLNQDPLLASPHQQAVQAHPHAIAGVGREFLFPQRLGHHPEDLTAIERKRAVGKHRDIEVTQSHVALNSLLKTCSVRAIPGRW